jgi:hypothetical protein
MDIIVQHHDRLKYSKPSLIRISEAKGSPKKKLRTQINGKFNYINSSDENK